MVLRGGECRAPMSFRWLFVRSTNSLSPWMPASMNGTLPRCSAVRTLAAEKDPEATVTRSGTASQSRAIRRRIGWKYSL